MRTILLWSAFALVTLNRVTWANVIKSLQNMGYTTIPLNLITANTTYLYLHSNPLGSIPSNTFINSGLTVIFRIGFRNCDLTDFGLNRDSFVGLENVKQVRLALLPA